MFLNSNHFSYKCTLHVRTISMDSCWLLSAVKEDDDDVTSDKGSIKHFRKCFMLYVISYKTLPEFHELTSIRVYPYDLIFAAHTNMDY